MIYDLFKKYGKLHRDNDPAFIFYREDGSIWSERYYMAGILQREDGDPAIIRYDIDEENPSLEEYYIVGRVVYK